MNLRRVWFVAAVSLLLFGVDGLRELDASVGPEQSRAATSAAQNGQPATELPGEMGQPLTAPLDINVQVEPWAFRANHRWILVYELHIANIGSDDCILKQIEVIGDGDKPGVLARISGKDLDAAIVHPWVDVSAPGTLGPATTAVVFMWLSIEEDKAIPASLSHRITMRVGRYTGDLSITTPSLKVNRNPVPVVGPPLQGADWGAAHGPDNSSRHRRGLLTIEGHSYIAERYAIDWLRISPSGDIHTGSGDKNSDYPGYGANVLAVADGILTEVLDDIPENRPGQPPAVAITLHNICGNHIIEKVGTNVYASYCHLQPGIRVRSGARVKRGQVLGRVGNSGSSDAPHLHFQLCNANSTLACEGVPYAFSSFIEEHRSFNSADGTKTEPDTRHLMEIPTDETLVDFQ